MALVLADRVRETTTVVGTGTATLLGAITGFQSFAAVGNANTTYYTITHQNANEWEVGIGTYTASGTLLSRDTVLSSSNGGSLVNFSAGTKDVWVDYSAEKAVTTDTLAYPPAIGGTTPAAGTFTTLSSPSLTAFGVAADVNLSLYSKGTGEVSMGTDGGEALKILHRINATRPITIRSGATGVAAPTISVESDLSSQGIDFAAKNAGAMRFLAAGQVQFQVSSTTSAVNFVQVTGAATGGAPVISAQGSDATAGLTLNTKSTGVLNLQVNSVTRARVGADGSVDTGMASNGNPSFKALGVASQVNYLLSQGAAAGSAPELSARGTDTNIDLDLRPKGTGAVVAEGPFTATGQTSLGGAAGSESLRVVTTASAVNYLQAAGAATGFQPTFSVQGADANVGPAYSAKGTGRHDFYTQGINSRQFSISNTSSAVNYVQVTGAATGASPTISVLGSDGTQTLTLHGRGSAGGVNLGTGFGTSFRVVGFAGSTIVNNLQAQGSATTISPVLSAQGSDTNISQVFQSKGTGAINLAPGSSGVNISNGGTVTAITRTTAGSGYTTIPSVAVSAPTTAGGVQATASVTTMFVLGGTLASGGTGYTVGDTLTVVGGTTGAAATVTVNAVSGGVITSASVIAGANYTVLPTNPVAVTGGTGSGATFNLTYGVSATGVTITNAGSGYVEQPTVTFSGGGGSGAAAYAAIGSAVTVKALSNNLNFYAANTGIGLQVYDAGGGSGASGGYWRFAQNFGTQALMLSSAVNASISTGGAGNLSFFTNTVAQEQLRVAHTASAVNYVQVTGHVTGASASALGGVLFTGSDTNVNGAITTKGVGYIAFAGGGSTSTQAFRVVTTNAASTGNLIAVQGAAAGSSPSIQAISGAGGTDANIDLTLTPKGTGNVRFGTYTADMTLVVQGYVEIKDSGGTIRKLAVIA